MHVLVISIWGRGASIFREGGESGRGIRFGVEYVVSLRFFNIKFKIYFGIKWPNMHVLVISIWVKGTLNFPRGRGVG